MGNNMKTTNQKCREYVQNRVEFTANNLKGVQVGEIYVVYSYGWYPLFIHDGEKWYENYEKYSVSTSKQRTQAHPLVDCIQYTTQQLKDMVERGQ